MSSSTIARHSQCVFFKPSVSILRPVFSIFSSRPNFSVRQLYNTPQVSSSIGAYRSRVWIISEDIFWIISGSWVDSTTSKCLSFTPERIFLTLTLSFSLSHKFIFKGSFYWIKLIIAKYLSAYLLLASLTQFRFRNPLNFFIVLNEENKLNIIIKGK